MNMHLVKTAFFAAMVIVLSSWSASADAEDVRAPDFELADLSGGVTRLSALRGKVVVLNFWATWCPECVEEMPSLNAFANRYHSKDVIVLGISVDRSEEAVRKYLKIHPTTFTVLLDGNGDVFVTRYRTRALPTTVIVDRQGAIAARLAGRQNFLSRRITSLIDGLLKGGT